MIGAKESTVDIFKALANEKRLQILEWLRDPGATCYDGLTFSPSNVWNPVIGTLMASHSPR